MSICAGNGVSRLWACTVEMDGGIAGTVRLLVGSNLTLEDALTKLEDRITQPHMTTDLFAHTCELS